MSMITKTCDKCKSVFEIDSSAIKRTKGKARRIEMDDSPLYIEYTYFMTHYKKSSYVCPFCHQKVEYIKWGNLTEKALKRLERGEKR